MTKIEKKVSERVAKIEQEKKREVDQIVSQYEYWIKKSQDQLNHYLEQFAEYSNNKRKQIEEYRQELLILYRLVKQLSQVIENAEKGLYPVHHHPSGIKALIIPTSDKVLFGWGVKSKKIIYLGLQIKLFFLLLKKIMLLINEWLGAHCLN